ncbi:MAG: hypothetical protein RLY87_1016 [Chloroflexota bacterium]
MTNKTSTFELLATMFMFSMLLSSGIFYTLGARFHLSVAWPVIPGIAIALTALMYWRVRVRRGASQADRLPPQSPSSTPPHQDQ